MARKAKRRGTDKRQLAALATLLGLMQTASKLSGELEALSEDIGGSLDEIVETAGVPFGEVHRTLVDRMKRKRKV